MRVGRAVVPRTPDVLPARGRVTLRVLPPRRASVRRAWGLAVVPVRDLPRRDVVPREVRLGGAARRVPPERDRPLLARALPLLPDLLPARRALGRRVLVRDARDDPDRVLPADRRGGEEDALRRFPPASASDPPIDIPHVTAIMAAKTRIVRMRYMADSFAWLTIAERRTIPRGNYCAVLIIPHGPIGGKHFPGFF